MLFVGRGVGVYDGGAELGYRTDQDRLGSVCDGVGFGQGGLGVEREVGVGLDLVADPSHPYALNPHDPRDRGQDVLGAIHQLWLHGIHQPTEHLS